MRFRTDGTDIYNNEIDLTIVNIRPYPGWKSAMRYICRNISDFNSRVLSHDTEKFTANAIELHNCCTTKPVLKSFLRNFHDLKTLHGKTGKESYTTADGFDAIRNIPRLTTTLEEFVVDDSPDLR